MGPAVLPRGRGLNQAQRLWRRFIQGRPSRDDSDERGGDPRRRRGGARLPPQGQRSLPGGGIRQARGPLRRRRDLSLRARGYRGARPAGRREAPRVRRSSDWPSVRRARKPSTQHRRRPEAARVGRAVVSGRGQDLRADAQARHPRGDRWRLRLRHDTARHQCERHRAFCQAVRLQPERSARLRDAHRRRADGHGPRARPGTGGLPRRLAACRWRPAGRRVDPAAAGAARGHHAERQLPQARSRRARAPAKAHGRIGAPTDIVLGMESPGPRSVYRRVRSEVHGRHEGAYLRLMPVSTDSRRRLMEPQERKQFVHLHRTCIFGYNRKNDGPSMSVTYYLMADPDTILISTMAARGKAKAVARNPKVSLCVLDEKWPPTYLQVYCDARIDATMESEPQRVIDSMMRLYDLMAGKPMPEAVRAEAAETARREQRVILLLKAYATFETPPRHVYSEKDA